MELRLYSFCNFYLSSIQQGIQTGHAAVDLVRLYAGSEMVADWADNWKTFIILNGGDNDGVQAAGQIIFESGFPHMHFAEPGLGGIKTCWTVVLPESIFNAQKDSTMLVGQETFPIYTCNVDEGDAFPKHYSYGPDHKHYQLVQLLRSSGLAK